MYKANITQVTKVVKDPQTEENYRPMYFMKINAKFLNKNTCKRNQRTKQKYHPQTSNWDSRTETMWSSHYLHEIHSQNSISLHDKILRESIDTLNLK